MSTTTPVTPNDETLRLNALAVEVPLSEIIVGDRIRRDFNHIPDLARSLAEDGLIQPIVLTYDKRLIAGESRIRAAKSLGWSTIRAVFRGVLDEAQLVILEATENNVRQSLTWQERVLSVDKVHRLRATNAMLSGESWGVRETGVLLKQGKSNVGLAVFLAEYLHKNDQDLWNAESAADAYRIIVKRREDEANAALARATLSGATNGNVGEKPTLKYVPPTSTTPSVTPPVLSDDEFFSSAPPPTVGLSFGVTSPTSSDELPGGPSAPLRVPLSQMLIHGDTVEYLRSVPDATFDHCITDWPFGINMDNFIQNVSSTANEHDVEDNLRLQRAIVPEIYRTLKPSSFFITWMDAMHWNPTYDLLTAAGFKCQRWPLVWHKTSSCANQAAQTNFTKNYELAIVARKGTPTLISAQASSVWMGGNDIEAKALGHPFAKPFGLWDWLYSAVTIRGQHILEPFAGRGSAIIPAVRRGLRVTAVEVKKEHHDALVVNVSNVYRSMCPNVEFV